MALQVLVPTIVQYLGSHKRLVVPQLGAFIVKVPGENVVFSELLRQDDGTLKGLLHDEGMNELEAAGAVDRFVFEVRHAVQNGGEYVMEGFGVFRSGANKTVTFAYEPWPATVAACAAERVYVEPKISLSPKIHPEPYVKGLRYGKPEKTTNIYTYLNRAPRRRGFDKLLLVAIASAVIALGAIAYGYFRESDAERAEAEFTEQTLPAEDSSTAPKTEGQTTSPEN